MITATSKTCGIYKLVHLPTNKFYIGSSVDVYHRYHVHIAQMKRGKAQKALKALWTGNKNEWKVEMLEECSASVLEQQELVYLKNEAANPLCINKRIMTNDTGRGIPKEERMRHRLAGSMLGKNTTDGIIRRPISFTLIHPNGTKYTNIKSINEFAREHNIHQSALNNMINGKATCVEGWVMDENVIPPYGDICKYWSIERIQRSYPSFYIIGPDGTKHLAFSIPNFEMVHNVSVMTKLDLHGVRHHWKGLNAYGQGYRLEGTDSFTIIVNGTTYTNVISITKLMYTLGYTYETIHRLLSGKRVKNVSFSYTRNDIY